MVATKMMTCQTTAVMRRKIANACIRQDTTPTSYPTHIGVLKDKEGSIKVKAPRRLAEYSISLSIGPEKDFIKVKA